MSQGTDIELTLSEGETLTIAGQDDLITSLWRGLVASVDVTRQWLTDHPEEPFMLSGGSDAGLAATTTVVLELEHALDRPARLVLDGEGGTFEGVAPEGESPAQIWTLADVPDPLGTFEAEGDTLALKAGERAVLTWTARVPAQDLEPEAVVALLPPGPDGARIMRDPVVTGETMRGTKIKAARATTVGEAGARVAVSFEGPLFIGPQVERIAMTKLSQSAAPNPWAESPLSLAGKRLLLDRLYSGLRVGDAVLLEHGDDAVAAALTSVAVGSSVIGQVTVDDEQQDVTIPVTQVEFLPALPPSWSEARLVLRYRGVDGGVLVRPAKTQLSEADLVGEGQGVALRTPVSATADDALRRLALVDANGYGAIVRGRLVIEPPGGRFILDAQQPQLTEPLRPPVQVYGSLVDVTRGKRVEREVLGSGDASLPWQTFTLRKSPLTYVPDPSGPAGRRSTLKVRVDGVEWTQVPSLLDASANARVYVVSHDDEAVTHVNFGDGRTGARLPTGANNVIASYRHGVEGNAPELSLTSLSRPVKGVVGAFNPIPATGGQAPPTPLQRRDSARRETLLLRRAVSLPDYQALAVGFPGVQNARARWGWDAETSRSAVKVWIITDGDGDVSSELAALLRARGEVDTEVCVEPATPLAAQLELELEIDPRYVKDQVELAAYERLLAPGSGLLAPANAVIGGHLYRSRLFAALMEIPGVLGVRNLLLGGDAWPSVLAAPDGRYFDLSWARLSPQPEQAPPAV